MSLLIVWILPQAKPVGWRNLLEEDRHVEVVLTVLYQAAEAAYSVQVFDWSGGKCREQERDSRPTKKL